MKAFRYLGQVLFFAAVALVIGWLSARPPYARVPPESALIKLSFAHGAEKKGECRKLSQEELAQLAPNMRRPRICPRERLPVDIEVVIDGAVVYADRLPPTGWPATDRRARTSGSPSPPGSTILFCVCGTPIVRTGSTTSRSGR